MALPLYEGKNVNLGSKDIELDRAISRDSYLSGTCFGQSSNIPAAPLASSSHSNSTRKFTVPSFVSGESKVSKGYVAPKAVPTIDHDAEAEESGVPSKVGGDGSHQSLYWTANW